MNKSNGILAFLVLCTSTPVFGQFHTITQQSKLYRIERLAEKSTSDKQQYTDVKQPKSISQNTAAKQSPAPQTHSQSEMLELAESSRQKHINDYLSVSFPMKNLKVNSSFGLRTDPFTGKKKKHNGLDLHAASDEVYAMLEGTVKKVGEDKRSGKYITIAHGEFLVSYCHLSHTWVESGIQVKPGEVVGITGNTGRSTGEHLHITCKRGNKYIDPNIFIQHIKTTQEDALKSLCSNP